MSAIVLLMNTFIFFSSCVAFDAHH
jgi:hypothetical protein